MQHVGGAVDGGFQQHGAGASFTQSVGQQGGFARRHGETELANGRAVAADNGGDADVATTGDLDASAHTVPVNGGNQRAVARQHGRQCSPHIFLVKGAQAIWRKTKGRVFGNVATGAEVAVSAVHDHATQRIGCLGSRLQVKKHITQLPPHAARHGVEFAGVVQHDPGRAGAGRIVNLAEDMGHGAFCGR